MAQYVYGKNVVLGLLEKKKSINQLFIQSNRNDKSVEVLARKNGVKVDIVDRKVLDKLVDGNHQGYVASVDDYKLFGKNEGKMTNAELFLRENNVSEEKINAINDIIASGSV